ncbi:hypothetical protein BASA81_004885 [Batrachochytrium salamandrivorans]|nr:hypothetical protein BASA81_004885 [Batrachochytrium salamandrivorans]
MRNRVRSASPLPMEKRTLLRVVDSTRDYRKVLVFGALVFLLFVGLVFRLVQEDEGGTVSPPLTTILHAEPPHKFNSRSEQLLNDIRFVENCPLFPQPGAHGRRQRCCQFTSEPFWYCLPNLVIAGSQKSGTTALFSHLMLHPEILPGSKKEFHLFDFDKSFLQLRQKLNQLLPRQDRNELEQFVVMDSTPTYIADVKACGRMAQLLSPDAKFIVLLRNPIHRLWSDIQMKQRRIDSQNEFKFDLVPQFYRELAHCMGTNLTNLVAFRHCLPERLSKHGRIAAFHKYFNQPKQRTIKAHLTFMNHCLISSQQALICMQMDKDMLKETMPILPKVIDEEMIKLQRDLQFCCTGGDEDKPHLIRQSAFYGGLPLDGGGCGQYCFPQAKMMSDISKNFVWRSIYSRQLKHCFEFIPRNRFLIVDSEALRSQPVDTLKTMLKHAGLNSEINLAALPSEEIHQVFADRFPDFESMTGWKHESTKHELILSQDLRQRLIEFFRPLNRELFTLLDVDPYPNWDV